MPRSRESVVSPIALPLVPPLIADRRLDGCRLSARPQRRHARHLAHVTLSRTGSRGRGSTASSVRRHPKLSCRLVAPSVLQALAR